MVRRRGQSVRRRVAEGRARAVVHAGGRARPAARRAHLGAGRASRVRPLRTAALAHARPHRGVHLAPLLHCAPGGSDRLPRAWAARGGGHPRGADRAGWALRAAVQDAGRSLYRRGHRARAGKRHSARRTTRLKNKRIGLAIGVVAAAVYLIGGRRVFGYDSAVTFANFIATPNVLDAFAVHTQQATIPLAQIAGNDHVLVSLVGHVIYSLTGTRSEIVYRLLPALAAGGTVGVTTIALASRFGLLAGIPAGLYVATNPMFVENSRDLRGYSLATFCGLVATVMFFGPRTRWRIAAYGALLVVAAAGLLWLVIQPLYLYPRFFIFLIPGCAFVLAAAIKRWKVLAPVVVLGAVAAAVSQVPDYTTDPLALRQAAAVVAEADASGKHVCLIHSDEQVLGAYAPAGFTVVTSADQLKSCDMVVVVSWGIDIPLRDEAARDFPRRTSLPAVYPTIVLER